MQKKFYCIRVFFSSRLWYIAFDTPVMLQRRTNVPAVFTVETPRRTLVRFKMKQNSSTWWCKRCRIKIEVAKEICVSGELGVDP